MYRFTIASVFGLFAAVAANAGSVLIGGSTGLSSNYITQGAGAACAAGAGNCITGSTTGYGEKNFDNVLFQGALNGTTAPVPFTGYTQLGGTPAGQTATDTTNNVSFAMISDGVNNATSNQSNNYWQSTGTGGATDSIVVPIGVFGAASVWTMLDNTAGILGGNDTTVTFDFGATSNATSGLTVVTVALDNNNNTPLNGELRAALSCTAGTSVCFETGPNPRGTLAQGTVIDGVTVNEGVVFNTFSYNNVPATSPFYTNTTAGKAKLDDQQFVFSPTLSNEWLVSMTITENVGNTTVSNPSAPSETALSAITVDTAVPEPGSILLFLSGIGGLGLMRFRRRNG
jgi:hypothetical protein